MHTRLTLAARTRAAFAGNRAPPPSHSVPVIASAALCAVATETAIALRQQSGASIRPGP